MWIPHLLQLLAVFCCNVPEDNNDFPTKKRMVLESIADIAPSDVENKTVFGQYSYGVGNERSSTDLGDIRPYRQEPGVRHDSTTETFCAVELEFNPTKAADNGLDHWCGIPFLLISGKRMHRKETGVWIEFKKADALEKLFEADPETELCERWNIRFQPFPAILRYHVVKAPGNYNHLGMGRSRYNYVKHYPNEPLRDYATLLHEAIAGQNFWFVKANTILESWRIGQSIVDFRESTGHRVHRYTSGDPGPLAAFYEKFRFLYLPQLGLID
jgi:glucose-6-phosphate 1-dehydrogenase